MKELSSIPYFDKTSCNMVVLKALGSDKWHLAIVLAIYWLFGLKITFDTFF